MPHQLILSLDYELFGDGSGCVECCLVKPMQQCMEIVEAAGARLSVFVEALEFECMSRLQPEVYRGVHAQLQRLVANGHQLALHLHPQWLDATLAGDRWQLDFSKWRTGDLTQEDLERALRIGLEFLARYTNEPVTTFRAGGWNIQGPAQVTEALAGHGLQIDSTAAPGSFISSRGDWFDFRRAPRLPYWGVGTDVCAQAESGGLLEVPIATAPIGALNHLQDLRASRRTGGMPEGCQGSYAGPNGRFDQLRAKFDKLRALGRPMLDFSTLSAAAMIQLTENYIDDHRSEFTRPIPVVAIGHNKNFTERSAESLAGYLRWVAGQSELTFATYDSWLPMERIP